LRTLSLVIGLPAMIFGGVVLVAHDAQNWTDVVILSVGVVTVVVTYERWSAQDLARFGPPGLALAALVWPLSVWLTDSPNGWYGVTLVGALSVPRLPRYRYLASAALVTYVAAVGAAHLLLSHGEDIRHDLFVYLLLPTGITASPSV
jgi:two-component system sensor histidine kinase DesK